MDHCLRPTSTPPLGTDLTGGRLSIWSPPLARGQGVCSKT